MRWFWSNPRTVSTVQTVIGVSQSESASARTSGSPSSFSAPVSTVTLYLAPRSSPASTAAERAGLIAEPTPARAAPVQGLSTDIRLITEGRQRLSDGDRVQRVDGE